MFLEGSGDEGPLVSHWSVSCHRGLGMSAGGDGTDCFFQIHLAILWEKDCES